MSNYFDCLFCYRKLSPMTLTLELHLDSAKENHRARYLGQRPSLRMYVSTQTCMYATTYFKLDTHTGTTALPGPLKWSEKITMTMITRHQVLAGISLLALCCHSKETHAPTVNPPNSAQLEGTPYHSPNLHPGPCSSVGMWRGTDRHTDTQTAVTTIHFASATPQKKCNDNNDNTVGA